MSQSEHPWYETAWSQAAYEQFIPEWESVEKRTADIVRMCRLRQGMRILDVACGSGAETSALALMGYDVTALDFSSAMLDVARRIAREKTARVDWRCGDMRRLDEQGKYDLVMVRDVIFGIFDHETNLDVLTRLGNAVKKGGCLLLEVYNKDVAVEKKVVEGFLSYNPALNRFEGTFEKPVDEQFVKEFASCEFFSVQEWPNILSGLQFREVSFYPSDSARLKGLGYTQSLVIDVVGFKE